MDMAALAVGESVNLSNLTMPEGVRLVDLHEAGDDSDRQVAAVNAPRVEAEPTDDDAAAPEADAPADDAE